MRHQLEELGKRGCRAQLLESERLGARALRQLAGPADLIHLGSMATWARFRDSLSRVRASVVVTCQGVEALRLPQLQGRARDEAIDCVQAAAVVHTFTAPEARCARALRVPDRLIVTCPPGVDCSQPWAVSEPEINRSPVVVVLAELDWWGGVDHLLAGLARVRDRGVAFRAEIIGEGTLRSKVRFSIEDLGLEASVRLHGPLDEQAFADRMRGADLAVVPGHAEGFSFAALVAMSWALPVVAATPLEVGDTPVRDGIDGFVVPARGITAMADRIVRLVGDPGLRAQMGSAARTRAETSLSAASRISCLVDLFRAAIDRGRVGGPG